MDKDIYNILSKFFSGSSTREEEIYLEEWLSRNEDNRAYFEDLQQLWKNTIIKEHYSNKETVFEKVLNGIQIDDHEYIQPHIRESNWYKKFAFVAASVLILLAVSVSFYFFFTQEHEEEVVVHTRWVEKVNPAGQKSKIYLPDGTIAFLNAESSLKYMADFTDSTRDIYLEGEAYFEVKKDVARPFRVYSNNIYVTALGTKFNVNAFGDESSSQVSLVEGKVSITANEHFEILNPGESLLLQNEKNQVSKFETDMNLMAAWKDGILIFEGDTLEEMVKKLERWYGVSITITGNPNKDMKYKGMFANEYLSNVLESMRYGREFDFTINGKNVNLNF